LNATISSTTCTFSTHPSISIKISESHVNTLPAKISEIITWNVNATNNGPTDLKSYTLEMTYPQYTYPTAATLSNWTCGANNFCNYTGGSLLSGQSVTSLQFSVQVLNNTPITTTQVCNNLTMISMPNQPNCNAQDKTTDCVPVNPGTPDISLEKIAFSSQYTFTIDYKNEGSGEINNLFLQEILQVGWTLNQAASTNGWKCGDTLCVFNVSTVSAGASGSILFVVDVNEASQTVNGTKMCWKNIASSVYDDEKYDPTPLNNQASVQIGSSCKECCDPAPCPTNVCSLQCPPQNITVPCPPVQCKCTVPEYWCPPCQKDPPSCNCATCSDSLA